MSAYYNEFDPYAAAWLRELIARGLVAQGDVDERSITEVTPSDLERYTQCHFFAGIGVWSYALRRAGWADDARVWTGSCPCQPFSASGQQRGTDDERHLWPAWVGLIRECRPDTLFGEQVASKAGLGWLDFVSHDLEGAGYAVGACDFPAAGVGAPHIRQRLYFVGERTVEESSRLGRGRWHEGSEPTRGAAGPGPAGIVADTARDGVGEHARAVPSHEGEHEVGSAHGDHAPVASGAIGELAESNGSGRGVGCASRLHDHGQPGDDAHGRGEDVSRTFWSDAEWIPCRDGKARPVEPGLEPLAYGAPARVVRLRGYGNALCAPQAQAFIEAYLDLRAER